MVEDIFDCFLVGRSRGDVRGDLFAVVQLMIQLSGFSLLNECHDTMILRMECKNRISGLPSARTQKCPTQDKWVVSYIVWSGHGTLSSNFWPNF